jgi:hypothetical protein
MSTRRRKIMFLGGRAWPVCRADNLTAICESNAGFLTSHNPTGLQGLLQRTAFMVYYICHSKLICTMFLYIRHGKALKKTTVISNIKLYLIEQLQQDGQNIRMSFINFIKQNNGIWKLRKSLGQLASIIMSYVTRRSANQLCNLKETNMLL